MSGRFFVLADAGWLLTEGKNPERLSKQSLTPLSPTAAHLEPGCSLLVKFRDGTGVRTDDGARLEAIGDRLHVKSEALSGWLRANAARGQIVAFYFEGTKNEARCVVSIAEPASLLSFEDPDRLAMYALPPAQATVVDAETLVSALYELVTAQDKPLFALHADRFLESPHIITALFAHLMSIRTEDNIRFPIQVKKIADVLRAELERRTEDPRIVFLPKSHLDLWSEVQGRRYSFLDGGAARIGSLPGLSPMALRVGVYSVRPGSGDHREAWEMKPYVVADLLDSARRPAERYEPRRLQEAARYTLEPLSGLLHLAGNPDVAALFMHGPLVNQFTQYDEGEPNYIPFLTPDFLASVGLSREDVERELQHIPSNAAGPLWNQFMAVYGVVMRRVNEHKTPIISVVERPTGRAITHVVLRSLEEAGAFTAAYTHKVKEILERYDITDDFLFGCMLKEGEYLTPVVVQKNIPRKARPSWNLVVRQYPAPAAMLMKSEETNFPFRVELNESARQDHPSIARFLYHTARLLPRYAFPVGLDIADKYAKIPDWLSRGISAELAAKVLREAMRTGDPNVVTQLRLFLARGPRDFFYRPTA